MSWVARVMETLPQAWKGALAVIAMLSMGASAGYAASHWVGYPARLEKLEQDTALLMTGFKYMTCRTVVQDEGGDPRVCRRVVQEIDEFMAELMGR